MWKYITNALVPLQWMLGKIGVSSMQKDPVTGDIKVTSSDGSKTIVIQQPQTGGATGKKISWKWVIIAIIATIVLLIFRKPLAELAGKGVNSIKLKRR